MLTTFAGLMGIALLFQAPGQAALTIPPSVAQMVIVDAAVTGTKGRPITSLRVEDFELFEDGRPVEIVSFQPPAPASSSGPSSGVSPAAQPDTREAMTLAIYVDRWLLSSGSRKRALDQAAMLSDLQIARGARVLVIADDKGLRSLTPLTTDPAVVRSALDAVQTWQTTSPGGGEARNVMNDIEATIKGVVEMPRLECDCLCVLPELMAMVRGYASARAREAQAAADRLAFVASAIGPIPGRKALLYVSEGLEQRPGVHLYDQLGTICPKALLRDGSSIQAAMGEFETSAPLRAAAARANAARVTIYPLDARGLPSFAGDGLTVDDPAYAPSKRSEMVQNANLTNPLELLGEETGGFALLRGLDPTAAMKSFDAVEQGHYVVGFVPGEADGQIHRLELRLSRKALAAHKAEIKHRLSYLRSVPSDRRAQRAMSTMAFGLEENTLGVEAEAERTSATTARIRVVLLLKALTALPGTEEGRVRLVVSFRSVGDDKSAPVVREKDVGVSLDARELELEGGLREFVVDIPVGASAHDVVIGVEDVASGTMSYLKRLLPPQEN